MTIAFAVTLTCFVGLGTLVILNRFRGAQPDILTERSRSKVIVTLDDGSSFRGVLWTHDATGIVLRNADALEAGERGTDLAVDGEVFLPRERVGYVQVL